MRSLQLDLSPLEHAVLVKHLSQRFPQLKKALKWKRRPCLIFSLDEIDSLLDELTEMIAVTGVDREGEISREGVLLDEMISRLFAFKFGTTGSR